MANIFLLSEINPRGVRWHNPISQADRWFNLLSQADLKFIGDPRSASLTQMIKLIHQRVDERGGQLLLRDWNHLDFVAVSPIVKPFPFEREPTNHLSLAAAMSNDFKIRNIAIVRHPLDQAESTMKFLPKNNLPPLEYFLAAQRRFAEVVVDIDFIRYEDFVQNTDGQLARICTALDMIFDPEYRKKWSSYSTITGDTGNKSTISLSPRKQPSPEVMERLLSNADYCRTCEILNYQP